MTDYIAELRAEVYISLKDQYYNQLQVSYQSLSANQTPLVSDPNIINMEDQLTNMTNSNDDDNTSWAEAQTHKVAPSDSASQQLDTLVQVEAQVHQVDPKDTAHQQEDPLLQDIRDPLNSHNIMLSSEGSTTDSEGEVVTSPVLSHQVPTSDSAPKASHTVPPGNKAFPTMVQSTKEALGAPVPRAGLSAPVTREGPSSDSVQTKPKP